MIPDEAVDAARSRVLGDNWLSRTTIRAILEAAAPYIVREAQELAWSEGHESGFWNGRESSGHHEMRYVGLEHAQINNPYGSQQ